MQEELDKALDQVVWVDFVCSNQHTMAKKDYGKVSARHMSGYANNVHVLPAINK